MLPRTVAASCSFLTSPISQDLTPTSNISLACLHFTTAWPASLMLDTTDRVPGLCMAIASERSLSD